MLTSTCSRGTFKSSNGHKIMGLIVMIIMTLQPIIGTVHHLLFKKRQTSTWYGVIHRFFGRIAVIAGAINVGLGLMLGPPPVRRIVAYSVLTAVFGTLYVVVTVFFGPEAKKRPNFVASTTNTPREGSIDTTSTANTTGGVEKEATNIIRLREL